MPAEPDRLQALLEREPNGAETVDRQFTRLHARVNELLRTSGRSEGIRLTFGVELQDTVAAMVVESLARLEAGGLTAAEAMEALLLGGFAYFDDPTRGARRIRRVVARYREPITGDE